MKGNKMKRKNLLVLLCVFLLAFALVACGTDTDPAPGPGTDPAPGPGTDPAPPPAPPPQPGQATEIITLDWYMPGANDAEDSLMVWEAMNEYLAQFGLYINIVSLGWDELADMNELRLATGDALDIAYTWHGRFPNLARRGLLLDMSPWLEAHGRDLLDKFGDDFVSRMRFTDGGIYMMPGTGTALTPTIHFAFNADMVDQLGITLPARMTHAELADFLRTVKDDVRYPMIGAPGQLATSAQPFHYIAADTFGFDVYGDDPLTVRNVYELETTRENFRQIRIMTQEGLMYLPEGIGATQYAAALGHDEWLGSMQVYSGSNRSRESLSNQFDGLRLYTVQLYQPFGTGVNFEGNIIGSRTNNPDATVHFIYLLQTDETLNNFIAWGIEGIHWQRNADGYAEYLPQGDANFNRGPWQFGLNQFVRTPPAAYPDIEAEYAAINAAFHIPPSMGFIFDPTGLEAQLAAVSNILDEFRQPLSFGLVADVDAQLDTINTRIELAGGNEIIAEMQRQFDAWLASR